jgi:thioesterase domain-containing protein
MVLGRGKNDLKAPAYREDRCEFTPHPDSPFLMNDDLLRDTERFLHEQIPITHVMGVKLESYNGTRLVVTAPLEPNHNHLGTAFGGSLSALTTLTGYAMLWLQLGDRNAHIVIRESSIRYNRPVRGILRAVCLRPDDATLAAFRQRFADTGKAHVNLKVHIEHAGEICVKFEGGFVAIRP